MLPKVMKPVQFLFHGTAYDYSDIIEHEGLKPVNHDKVYLTADINVAYHYAKSKTLDPHTNSMQTVICVVDALQMYKDGFVFTHEATNAEYTVNEVPPHYLVQIVVESEDELELLAHYVQDEVFNS